MSSCLVAVPGWVLGGVSVRGLATGVGIWTLPGNTCFLTRQGKICNLFIGSFFFFVLPHFEPSVTVSGPVTAGYHTRRPSTMTDDNGRDALNEFDLLCFRIYLNTHFKSPGLKFWLVQRCFSRK